MKKEKSNMIKKLLTAVTIGALSTSIANAEFNYTKEDNKNWLTYTDSNTSIDAKLHYRTKDERGKRGKHHMYLTLDSECAINMPEDVMLTYRIYDFAYTEAADKESIDNNVVVLNLSNVEVMAATLFKFVDITYSNSCGEEFKKTLNMDGFFNVLLSMSPNDNKEDLAKVYKSLQPEFYNFIIEYKTEKNDNKANGKTMTKAFKSFYKLFKKEMKEING